ncbi:cysteine hydrolase [Cohnella pontilimi]|uniref:Cysteine hydrolase n=1 Tax=Cohnella pontilimi TaxID=2564100 RepID=A0A4U0F8I1_9BACL|nr:cysteine hydrolase family protein [Cohnella pontilimi]TJY40987.1 cysteine hydrolase [Cohnella pontilimi]
MKADTALLVIDVQVGMFSEAYPIYDGDGLLDRVNRLIVQARTSQVPVIYVQHNEEAGEQLETNTPDWQIHPAIAPAPGDLIIQKRTPDSFNETNLQHELESLGIKKLVLTGMQTDFCVDATSQRAHRLGYEVTVAEDAHSTFSQGDQSAEQIILQYNEQFRSFANVVKSSRIAFF